MTYRILAAICAWFSREYHESRIITTFLRTGNGETVSGNSILTRTWGAFHRAMCFIFEKLRLLKVFDGSITRRSFFWCALAVTLAPILPTMAVAGLAFLAFASVFIAFSCDRERKLVYSPINWLLLLFAFIYVSATFTSVTFSGSLKGGLLTVLFVVFALIFENSVTTKKQLDTAVILIVCAGFLVSAYGVYQYVFGVAGAESWIDTDMFSGTGTRVYSTLQNPNVLSEYLLLVIPFAFAMFLAERRQGKKLLYLCAAGAMCLCMLLTLSRGGWLGLIFAAAVFIILLDGRFIFLGIAALIALYFVLPESFIARFTSIGNLSDSSTSYRVAIWYGTLSMLKDYWFCGIGPGTAAFNLVYPLYSFSAAAAEHSHNLFLQITCDAGICGIAIFLATLFTYFRTTLSAMSRERDKKSRCLQAAAVAAIVGFLVQGMADNAFYNYRVLLMFWVILITGMLVSRRTAMSEVGAG
ncbi:MAG: O-antigen ligase family protein [Oscillospiraceae bacterium]